MALANFFDKAAMSAAQVLRGADHTSFTSIIESQTVGLAFDDQAAASAEGRAALGLAVNLLARLYPRLAIAPGGAQAEPLAEQLITEARAINPEIEIVDSVAQASAVLAAGASPITANAPVVYVGSDGWLAKVSSRGPIRSGDTENPFGAGAAACFGAANIFRLLFGQHLPDGMADDDFAMSLLDYEPNASSLRNPALGPVDLGESFLIGLGAIGNGAVWALSKTPALSGELHLVDHEPADLTNLQRYVLTKQTDVGAVKVDLAARHFEGTSLKVRPHPEKWGDYLRGRVDWNLQRVLVAVDSADDRRAVQASLPAFVINSWTQPGMVGVSRHSFLGNQACLMCLYFPEGDVPSESLIVARDLGLPEAEKEIGHLLYTGEPVSRELIEMSAVALGVSPEPLLEFVGQPLRAFYAGAICGGLVLRLGGGANPGRAEVPLAFQSALAGIMLAAELVAHASGLKGEPPPVTTQIGLLRPLPGGHLSLPATKHPSGACICQDPDYVQAYRNKYPAPSGQGDAAQPSGDG